MDALDDLDPATLLESLANFEHPPSSSEPPTAHESIALSSEHQFESLLQAAASADSQEAAQASRGQNKSLITERLSSANGNNTATRTKRKRKQIEDEEDSADDNFGFIVTNKTKRKRRLPADDPEQLAIEHEIWGPEFEGIEDGSQSDGRTISLAGADARAAGVHSAAALFRRPSAASKKYTSESFSHFMYFNNTEAL